MIKDINYYKQLSTLTVIDIAEVLRIGRNKAYNLVKSNQFPVLKIQNAIRIPSEPFFEWLNA